MRYAADGRGEWCVIFQGRAYPFGPDNFGKELAEWSAPRLEAGKDSYGASSEFVLTEAPEGAA
jgi:hypothetical protein